MPMFSCLLLSHDLYSVILNDTNVTSKSERLFIEKVSQILDPVQSVCYWVQPEFNFIFSIVLSQNKSAFILTHFSSFPSGCTGLVFLGFPGGLICDFFLKFKLFYLTIDRIVVFGNKKIIMDLPPLTSCSLVFDFAHVFVVSLLENVTYKLSLPFTLPRSFKYISVSNASLKFNDTVLSSIKVATFHCYPFSIMKPLDNGSGEFIGKSFFKFDHKQKFKSLEFHEV